MSVESYKYCYYTHCTCSQFVLYSLFFYNLSFFMIGTYSVSKPVFKKYSGLARLKKRNRKMIVDMCYYYYSYWDVQLYI